MDSCVSFCLSKIYYKLMSTIDVLDQWFPKDAPRYTSAPWDDDMFSAMRECAVRSWQVRRDAPVRREMMAGVPRCTSASWDDGRCAAGTSAPWDYGRSAAMHLCAVKRWQVCHGAPVRREMMAGAPRCTSEPWDEVWCARNKYILKCLNMLPKTIKSIANFTSMIHYWRIRYLQCTAFLIFFV